MILLFYRAIDCLATINQRTALACLSYRPFLDQTIRSSAENDSSSNRFSETIGYRFYRQQTVYTPQQALATIVVDERCGLFRVDVKPATKGFRIVVLASEFAFLC